MGGSVNANDDLVQVRRPAPDDEDGAPGAADNTPGHASHEQTAHHPMTTPAQNDGVSPETLGLMEHAVDRCLVDNGDVGVRPA
jgi:hypothetical protein